MALKVALACGACRAKNYRMGKSNQQRLVIRKFCKKCKQHTSHKEEK